jgi:IS605 OrfB family transposase
MKIRLFPTNEEKEILDKWFGMTRYVYNQSLISLKVLTEKNPLNDFYGIVDNLTKTCINVKDDGTVNLNIFLNPIFNPDQNKCKFVLISGKNKGKECGKNCFNFEYCLTHSKKKISPTCKFIMIKGKNKGSQECGKKCGNSGFCVTHSTKNSKCKKILKTGNNAGKECGKNCGDSDFCPLHSKKIEKRESIDEREDECSFVSKKTKKKCGKKCSGELCDAHLKIFEKSKIKNLEPSKIDIREFVRRVRVDDSVDYFADPKKSREELLKEFNEKGKSKYVYDDKKEDIIWSTEWCPKFPSRMFRGSIDLLTQDINSCISNGNYELNMRVKTKKDKNLIINSDQWNSNIPFPSELSGMNGYYTIAHKRIPLSRLFKNLERRSYQILNDEENKYFLNMPVSNSFFYEMKCKVKKIIPSENQTTDNRFDVCALDPGVRKFQTLYGVNHVVEVGSHDCYKILNLLKLGDKSRPEEQKAIRKKIKNLVDDLHRKTVSFLTSNYKTIFLPDFGTSEMLKGNISANTKREMQTLRFYTFKMRLIDKCSKKGVELKIVSEAYTTQCCSECGVLTKIGESENFDCSNRNCPLSGVELDRDFNSSRNILIRNIPGQCSCP